ncbi:MAG TPA: bacteriohopanetetrol glucosamine biosynthesis glycosyltransferase HpnI [Candidatus Acidoferrales bacterium]|nr:bacteriohopanetetrol glucosamine biosynthesis glycosyltransferase HpnI [Candidatus Acidoferrales bacterium]
MVTALTLVFGVLLAGSLVYCILVMLATSRYLSVIPPAPRSTPGISILKPLCGHDEGLEENLRSFFVQEYPNYEIIFGVHRPDDPAAAVAEMMIQEFSGSAVKARLVVTGESQIPNAKAYSLNRLVREAQYGLLVMCDSDVRVEPDLLSRLAREFENSRVGLITCPYRAVPGKSLWSRTEAVGMNTELLGGVMVARMIEGMRFALGCTIAVRREVLDAMGGFGYLQEFLAEDFVIGQRTAEMGWQVLLSSAVIQHRIGSQAMLRNFAHRLRWARSTRRSRPAGYWGQLFTYPLPLALLLVALWPAAWPLLIATVALRGAAAIATAGFVVHDPLLRRQWWLLPLQDVLGFLVWLGGFLGDKIVWRDRKCTVLRDGRLHVNP